jgi:hypothetical protein
MKRIYTTSAIAILAFNSQGLMAEEKAKVLDKVTVI